MTANAPRVVDLLRGDAEETWSTPYGTTGRVFNGAGIEAVWVSKEREEIDPGWFSQHSVDLIVVMQGQLRVEFADSHLEERTLQSGQMLILPADVACRAYRWPRNAGSATIFLAIYPQHATGGHV